MSQEESGEGVAALDSAPQFNGQHHIKLGEGAPDADGDKLKEMMQKAKEKTKKGIETEKQKQEAQLEAQQRNMKEMIEKTSAIQNENAKKAEDIVRQAPEKWQMKWDESMADSRKKWDGLREKGTKWLRKLTGTVATTKQQRTAYWMSQISNAQAAVKSLEEKQESWFMSQAAAFDQAKSKTMTRAKVQYEREVANLKQLMNESRESLKTQSAAVKRKYASLIEKAENNRKAALAKLKNLEKQSIEDAKKRIEKTKQDTAKQTVEAKAKGKEEEESATTILKEAEVTEKDVEGKKKDLANFKGHYKQKLTELTETSAKTTDALKNGMRTTVTKLDSELNSIKDKSREKVEQAEDKATQEATDRDNKEAKWQSEAKYNANQNCVEARETADMKIKAAQFAAKRVSREAQSEMVISKNNWVDAEEKARTLRKKQVEKEKMLNEKAKKVAIKMATEMYGEKPKEFDMKSGDGPHLIPKSSKRMLDDASRDFAKAFVPADQEEKKADQRDVVRKKAHDVASHKTWVWANNHAAKLAKKFHEKAEKQCVQSRKFFNEAEETVDSRVKEIEVEKKEEISKAQNGVSNWANTTRSELNSDKEKVIATETGKIAENQKQTSEELKVLKSKSDQTISKDAKTIEDETMKYETLKADGKMKLKLAKENTSNKLSELQDLRTVADKEAFGLEKNQQETTKQESMKIKERAEELIEGYKQKSIHDLQELKDTAGPVSPEQIAEAKTRLTSQLDSTKSKAEYDYTNAMDSAKRETKTIVEKAKANQKLAQSKMSLDLKQETAAADEKLQKAHLKERQQHEHVDGQRAAADERGEKAKAATLREAKRKREDMLLAGAEKARIEKAKIRSDFENEVLSEADKAKQKIEGVKEKVMASFEPSM